MSATQTTTLPLRTQVQGEGQRSLLPFGAANLSLSQVTRRSFRIAALLLTARLLGPESFGLYALLFTVTEMLALISGGAYSDYITREVAKDPVNGWERAVSVTQLRFVYLVGLAGLAILLLKFMRFSPLIIASAGLLSLALFPRAINESGQGILRGRSRFAPLLWVELLQGGVLFGIAALLLFRGYGLRGIILAELGSAMAGALLVAALVIHMRPRTRRGPTSLRELLRATAAFNIYPLIVNAYDRLDVVVLSKLAGNAAVGLYSLPYRAFASLQILPYGIMGALLPTFSKTEWNMESHHRCSSIMKFLYAAALMLILGTVLLANPAVLLLLGEKYQGSALALKILIWATVPMFLNYALNTVLLATHREKVFLWTASVCTVVNLTANVLLIPRFSFAAAAAVTVLTELVLFGQNLFFVRKAVGRVPLPERPWRITMVFFAVLSISLVASRFLPEMIVGFLAVALFSVYLCTTRSLPLVAVRRGMASGA